MKILTDCDGVLLDWCAGFDMYMLEKYEMELQVPETYCIGARFGKSPEFGKEMVLEYNSTDAIGNLKPVPGAVEAIKHLNEAYGMRFDVITAFSDDPDMREARVDNLHRYFGDVFDDVHAHSFTTSKSSYLKMYDPGHIWIEDHVVNAALGQELGHKALVLTHPYNLSETVQLKAEDKITGWADDWDELASIIERETRDARL